jgi:hypothetical protein
VFPVRYELQSHTYLEETSAPYNYPNFRRDAVATHLKQLLDGKLKKADRAVGVDTSSSHFGSSVALGRGGGGGVYLKQVKQ